MSTIQGGIPFAGLVAPTDSTDTYAVTDETYNRGSFRSVNTLSDRNSITTDRQSQGMLVYVRAENKTYQLSGVVGSNLWIEYKSSGDVTAETLTGSSLNSSISGAPGISSLGSSGKNLNIQNDKVVLKGIDLLGTSGMLKSSSESIVSAIAGVDYLLPNGNGSQLSGITPSQIGVTFGTLSKGSSKVSITGQVNNSVIGSGITIDVNEQNIIHNNLSGLTQGNPHTQYQLIAEKAQALGYASLDGGGKVPLSQLPSTLLQYEGQWNASTNIPTLIDPDTSKTSYVYEVSVAGNRFGFDWMVGDWLVYNASGQIERSINSNIVASVFGRTGAVTAHANDYNKSQISGLTDADDVTFNSEILSNLNYNTVVYADASKKLQSSIVTKAQLEYLSGVTSDVQFQIDSKVNSNPVITGNTFTKITYDSKGLVTTGTNATTADIDDSLNRRYVTDTQLINVQNLSGVNTGDETSLSIESKLGISSSNVVALQSLSGINTGDETGTSILSKIGAASSLNSGYLSSSDYIKFNNNTAQSMAIAIALG